MEQDERIREVNRKLAIELIRSAMLKYANGILLNPDHTDTMELATTTADKIIKELAWKP